MLSIHSTLTQPHSSAPPTQCNQLFNTQVQNQYLYCHRLAENSNRDKSFCDDATHRDRALVGGATFYIAIIWQCLQWSGKLMYGRSGPKDPCRKHRYPGNSCPHKNVLNPIPRLSTVIHYTEGIHSAHKQAKVCLHWRQKSTAPLLANEIAPLQQTYDIK